MKRVKVYVDTVLEPVVKPYCKTNHGSFSRTQQSHTRQRQSKLGFGLTKLTLLHVKSGRPPARILILSIMPYNRLLREKPFLNPIEILIFSNTP